MEIPEENGPPESLHYTKGKYESRTGRKLILVWTKSIGHRIQEKGGLL
jgi:hypothetical protein